jgi:hypothetical protein
MNEVVARWTLQGHLYLWRYKGDPRNYPGWHLTADADACQSLLGLIDSMQASEFSSRTEISLSTPTAVQFVLVNAPWQPVAAQSLTLSYYPSKFAPDHWRLVEDSGRVNLELGHQPLGDLRQGIVDVGRFKGDYCIGRDGEKLWFW